MKDTNRYIALALCLSLTLGAFVYRPPEAKAIAGVDDAVVIGALLTAFSAGCGLIFANNGMTSNEIAQGMTQKWNEFKETLSTVPSSFASWLGYDSTEELLASCVIVGPSKMNITRPIARKFAEFTDWLTKDLGVTPSSQPVTVADSNIKDTVFAGFYQYCKSHDFMGPYNRASTSKTLLAAYCPTGVYNDTRYVYWVAFSPYVDDFSFLTLTVETYVDGYKYSPGLYVDTRKSRSVECNFFFSDFSDIGSGGVSAKGLTKICDLSSGLKTSEEASDLSVHAPTGVQTPSLDIPAEGTEEAPITISGVGADAAAIEDLLQQILAQVQANTLAPTIEGVDTETGGGTDTEEDAKPYLPYIPQIFGKIKDLPDTLSNIWESIKGLPAAIAEKIGAFFTTLWGWLQSIIDAIKALPAAIAEKIKSLFVPREGYAAEFVADITATYQGRMGLLTYPFTVLADFVGTVATLEEQEPVLRWDAVEWQNKTIIAAGEYNLKSAVSSAQMQTVYMIYKTVVSGMLVVAFLHLCYKKLKEVQRN